MVPGPSSTRILMRNGRPEAIEFRRCILTVIAGPDAGKEVPLDGSRLAIGTSPACQLCLTDPAVSKSHCQIDVDEKGFRLRDLDSTNGVLLGGLYVRDVYLEPGTRFRVGASELELKSASGRAEIKLS